jgi:hypothetical protein
MPANDPQSQKVPPPFFYGKIAQEMNIVAESGRRGSTAFE